MRCSVEWAAFRRSDWLPKWVENLLMKARGFVCNCRTDGKCNHVNHRAERLSVGCAVSVFVSCSKASFRSLWRGRFFSMRTKSSAFNRTPLSRNGFMIMRLFDGNTHIHTITCAHRAVEINIELLHALQALCIYGTPTRLIWKCD